MSLIPPIRYDKHCFVYCGPERCDCAAGDPLARIETQSAMTAGHGPEGMKAGLAQDINALPTHHHVGEQP